MTQEYILLTPAQLTKLLKQTLATELEDFKAIASQQHPDILSVQAIVERSGFSQNVVRSWINEGRRVPGTGRIEKLKIIDGISDGSHRVRWHEWQRWLSLFPDIQA